VLEERLLSSWAPGSWLDFAESALGYGEVVYKVEVWEARLESRVVLYKTI
jgi:hypothetical protein